MQQQQQQQQAQSMQHDFPLENTEWIYFWDIEWMHVCLCKVGEGARWGNGKKAESNWCVFLNGTILASPAQRSQRGWTMTMTSESRAQTLSCFSENKGCLFSGPFFPPSGLILWVENVTKQYTDLCFSGNRLSLCRSAENLGGGGVHCWCQVQITWEDKITKRSDLCLSLYCRKILNWKEIK